MKVVNGLTLFWDGEFSNFWPAKFVLDDIEFCTSEQYYMYQKALHFKDEDTALLILQETNPAKQKKLGRQVSNFDEADWKKVMYDHMVKGCHAKFTQNEHLEKKLVATINTTMVEASPYDKIWGIGLGEENPLAWDKSTWQGENLLGKALDDVRYAILQDMFYSN